VIQNLMLNLIYTRVYTELSIEDDQTLIFWQWEQGMHCSPFIRMKLICWYIFDRLNKKLSASYSWISQVQLSIDWADWNKFFMPWYPYEVYEGTRNYDTLLLASNFTR